MLYSLSKTEDINLDDIKQLEGDIGKTLIAFSGHEIEPASIQDEELDKIKKLEKKLGVTLIAV